MMTSLTPVTSAEAKRIQGLRDAGLSVRRAAKVAGRSCDTIQRHTVSARHTPDYSQRNDRLLALAAGLTGEDREAFAIQHGFGSAHSMNVQLYKHRRRIRDASCNRAVAEARV